MSKSISMYVRGALALLLLGMGMYAGAETLAAKELASRGLTTCGDVEHPCEIAPLTVTVPRSDGGMPNAANAIQVLSAAPRALRAHPIATAES